MTRKLQVSKEEIDMAASYWNAMPLLEVPGSNHFFYDVFIHDRPYIMRLTSTAYRDMSSVEAELHWINFLSGKLCVARAIPSLDNKTAVLLNIGGEPVIACVFEKIHGMPLGEGVAWGSPVFMEWGKTMAVMHSLSKQYDPDGHRHKKLDGIFSLDMQSLKSSNGFDFTILQKHWVHIQRIPHEHWGIIHADLTPANLRFFNNQLQIFDFDDCQYAPFMYDIAVTIYVTLFGMRNRASFHENAAVFIEHFLKGYRMHNSEHIDGSALRLSLEFFNALVYLCCKQQAYHPFKEYAEDNFKYGTLHQLKLESFLN